MKRRAFLKSLVLPFLAYFSFGLVKKASAFQRFTNYRGLRIWSYFVPLTSYKTIVEDFPGKNPLDLRVLFEEVKKVTNRINGKETDGTKNPSSFEIEELEETDEYLRIKFWHDDYRAPNTGHSLYVFRRYLDYLDAGEKVFVATGMYDGHFHVVMIAPPV